MFLLVGSVGFSPYCSMAGLIPSVFIDDLLTRVDVVDLIDSYLPLKKTGSNYVARCPFHTEKRLVFCQSSQAVLSLFWLWGQWQCDWFLDGL